MPPTDLLIWAGLIGYVALAFGSATLFERKADRADFPQPGQYEVVRVFVGLLWFLWPWFWFTAWRQRNRCSTCEIAQVEPTPESERPPE